MKKRKPSTLTIYEILQEHGAISVEKGIEILIRYEPRPDPIKLERKYWADKFRRIMRTKRDTVGIRDAFSNEHGTYYNVPTTTDADALKAINLQIDIKRDGLIKASRKVSLRQAEVAGQMAFDFNAAL